jgi:hypothetical protein
MGIVKGEMTINQGDDVKKEDRKVGRDGKRRNGEFGRRQRILARGCSALE